MSEQLQTLHVVDCFSQISSGMSSNLNFKQTVLFLSSVCLGLVFAKSHNLETHQGECCLHRWLCVCVRNPPSPLLIILSLLLVPLMSLFSLVMWSGATVRPGRGKAAQEWCCLHTRLCPRRILQACPMPSFHWLLLVCAGGHGTTHTWDIHQVDETQPIQISGYCHFVVVQQNLDSRGEVRGPMWADPQVDVGNPKSMSFLTILLGLIALKAEKNSITMILT